MKAHDWKRFPDRLQDDGKRAQCRGCGYIVEWYRPWPLPDDQLLEMVGLPLDCDDAEIMKVMDS